jgi:hypothetical protein
MPRLQSAANGAIVSVSDEIAAALGSEWEPLEEASEPEGYAALKVADLKAEIQRRNEGRDDADLIPTKGKQAELVAYLEADDAAAADLDDESDDE